MVDPLAWFAIATAGLGLWTLATGRRLRNLPRWPVSSRSLRLFGAYEATASLLVLLLVATHNDGIAFLIYGLTALTLAASIQFGRPSPTRS
jgi:hypothetical protein